MKEIQDLKFEDNIKPIRIPLQSHNSTVFNSYHALGFCHVTAVFKSLPIC